MAHLRPARRRGVRWPTWAWAAVGWVWVAQAVMDGGRGGNGTARAGLGGAVDEVAAAAGPPVPSYRSEPLAVDPAVTVETSALVAGLTVRGARWDFLTAGQREIMDAAVAGDRGRAPWRRVVVEGTGEASGSGRDVALRSRRSEASGMAAGLRGAHFVIGNGTRSKDGEVETTGRPLGGEALVVVLVGDFSRSEPTGAQLRALTEVVDYARAKCGVIPVEVGEAARAPVAGSVLEAAYNGGLNPDPVGSAVRNERAW